MLRSCLIILIHEYNALPDVIDLFSGCGGLAFGFQSSGFHISHGIEINKAAANTASYNLYWKHGVDSEHVCADITLEEAVNIKPSAGNGYIVIGGPPCQAYSQIGKAKLRSLGNDRVHTNDSRGVLYQDFLRLALDLDAKVIVMENVPEATNYGGLNVPQHVCDILVSKGYEAHWTILNAADFGVPQVRERIFVIAILRSTLKAFCLPVPTHKAPNSQISSSQLRFKQFKQFLSYNNFIQPLQASQCLPDWVTVGEAFSDLPMLFPSSKAKYKLYKLNTLLEYRTNPQNQYQNLMRSWEFELENQVTGNAFRNTERDFPIFERMRSGDDYRNASIIADQILIEECRYRGVNKSEHPADYNSLVKKIVPPYDRTKFHSKWKKLDPNLPSHTVVAHLDTDTYSHIHPWEPRGISVREAARLQSFPDSFIFQGAMGESFTQIGNAVPPLMSKAIAQAIKASIQGDTI